MAPRQFAWVSIDALRDLVRYVDEQRAYVDQELACDPEELQASDEEFTAKVAALGVEELEH